jgi:uncharacterized protein YdeI (YjbR/CyaY-like superfamily)
MPTDPRVDAYIEKAAPFARPILVEIRRMMHAACPEFGEAIKWGMPFFVLGEVPIANMAAFKEHAAFGFWRREVPGEAKPGAMGRFGRLTSVDELPDEAALAAMVQEAIGIAQAGGKTKRTPPGSKPPFETPVDLRAALDAVPAAAAAFDGFPPSAQREYADWVSEAKQAATRARRIGTTVEWCAEGKRRYWSMAGR